MKHVVITAPSAIEQLAHDILDGTVTCEGTPYPLKHWRSAAADCVEGDPTDLEMYVSETNDWRNWDEREGRASESYLPISCERPCAALYGQYR